MKPVDRIARKRHGGVKPEAVRRADDVIVDGLRNTDHRNPFQAELMADREGSVAANDVAWGENARAVELQQSVEAVFKADAPDSTVPGGLDDSADDGVQPRRITAAGENAKSFNGTHPIRL